MDLDSPFPLSSIFSSNSKPNASNSVAWNWVIQALTQNKDSSLLPQDPMALDVSEKTPLLILNKESLESDKDKDGAELFKQDLDQFILRKRATTLKHTAVLKDSVGKGNKVVAVPKAQTFTTGADQISHRGAECKKAKKRKLNIQEDSELQKHISLIMDTHNSYKILPGDPSGSRERILQYNVKELELQNQISADPVECAMRVSQEFYGKELQFVTQVFSTPSADGWKEILLEDNFAFGHQSNQRNNKELQFLKHIYTPPFANFNKELLQVHGSGPGQQSSHWNNGVTLLPSAAEASDSGKFNLNGGWLETGFCLKCDEGGSLLVCKGSSCSLAIHDKCVDSSVDFDEKGNFYCPLCSYSRAIHDYHKAKQKYSQAKEVLASFIDKNWMRHNKEQVSHLVIERESHEVRMDGNKRCHGKHKIHEKNTKTSNYQQVEPTVHHGIGDVPGTTEISQYIKRTEIPNNTRDEMSVDEPIVHHRIGDVPGTTETSQYIKRTNVANNTGELDDEISVDDHVGIMERPIYRRLSCSFKNVDVNIPPLRVRPLWEVQNRTINGSQSTEFIKHRNTSSFKNIRKGYQSAECKQIAEAKSTQGDSYLACEAAETSNSKEIPDVSQAHFENEENLDEKIEENINNLHPMKEICSLTARKCARRKLKMQIDKSMQGDSYLACEAAETSKSKEIQDVSQANFENEEHSVETMEENMNNLHPLKEICSLPSRKCARRKLIMQIDNARADVTSDNVNLTCEKGEASRIVEAHALSQVNMKTTHVPPVKISEIQNQQHQEQAINTIEQYTYIPPDQTTCVSAQANERLNKGTRKYWTPEEEKALKDAMQKVSLDNGNIPWTKIWRSIKHKFQVTRQPDDLKVKWRNIVAKEARERGKGSGD